MRALRRVAIFPQFSLPRADNLSRPLLDGPRIVGIDIREGLHRFEIEIEPRSDSFRAANRVAPDRVAEVGVRLLPAPDDFAVTVGAEPPPTAFVLRREQRFVLTDGRFRFRDPAASGFEGFGAGRTFPTVFGAVPQIRIGAVVKILEGFGGLAGHQGLAILNGTVTPPFAMQLSVTPIVFDPADDLRTNVEIGPFAPLPNPDPAGTYLMFLTEHLPRNRVPALPVGDRMVFLPSRGSIRRMGAGFEIGRPPDGRPISRVWTGDVVGEAATDFCLGPIGRGRTMPFQARRETLTLHDRQGRDLGSLEVASTEGRGFEISLPGIPSRAWMCATIGPIEEGTGIFAGATGFISCGAMLSLFPRILSIISIVRLADPDGIYRIAMRQALGELPMGYGTDGPTPGASG